MVVDRARNTLAVSKADEASNKAGNPALDSTSNANRAANPANSLVDEDEQTKIAAMGNSLLNDELDAMQEAIRQESFKS